MIGRKISGDRCRRCGYPGAQVLRREPRSAIVSQHRLAGAPEQPAAGKQGTEHEERKGGPVSEHGLQPSRREGQNRRGEQRQRKKEQPEPLWARPAGVRTGVERRLCRTTHTLNRAWQDTRPTLPAKSTQPSTVSQKPRANGFCRSGRFIGTPGRSPANALSSASIVFLLPLRFDCRTKQAPARWVPPGSRTNRWKPGFSRRSGDALNPPSKAT